MIHIAIFASGRGSNAKQIISYFTGHATIRVALVVSNKPTAPVLDMAREHSVPTHIVQRSTFYDTQELISVLNEYQIDLIALAGFMWLVPAYLIRSYAGRILNIHPALLPAYGGKGMYGKHVHQAVYQAGERQSGITIHEVNERYDEGPIVFQATCPLTAEDTPGTIAAKVQQLEHQHFAPVIERFAQERLSI